MIFERLLKKWETEYQGERKKVIEELHNKMVTVAEGYYWSDTLVAVEMIAYELKKNALEKDTS